MPAFNEIIRQLFAADSIWSVVLRGGVWFAIAIVIIVSVDNPHSDRAVRQLKSNLGFFLMFLVLSSVLTFMLFGHVKA